MHHQAQKTQEPRTCHKKSTPIYFTLIYNTRKKENQDEEESY